MGTYRIYKQHGTLLGDDRVDGLITRVDNLEVKEIPLATEDSVGGIKAEAKTDDYVEDVRIDSETGKLYVKGYNQALVYRGSVENYTDLPTDAEVGDMYHVSNSYTDTESGKTYLADTNFAWSGNHWNSLGGNIDVSILTTKEELATCLEQIDTRIGQTAHELSLDENKLQLLDSYSHVLSTIDLPKEVDFKYTNLQNNDQTLLGQEYKEDRLYLTDTDAALSITHEDGVTQTNITVSKDYIELSTTDTSAQTGAAKVSIASDTVSVDSEDASGNKKLVVITPKEVKINDKEVITTLGGTFESKPKVQTNGTTSDIAIMDDLTNLLPTQSKNDNYYSLVDNSDGKVSIDIFKEGEEQSTQTFVINKDGIQTSGKTTLVNKEQLDGKVNTLAQNIQNAVYVRKDLGEDSYLTYSYSAEGDTIAKRSASGTLAVETPTQEKDAVNKAYIDSLFTNGTIEKPTWKDTAPEDTSKVLFTLVTITKATNYDNLVGKTVTCQGFTNNGFDCGNAIYVSGEGIPSVFIGMMTRILTRGVFITPNSVVTYANESGTAINAFTYKYLW